MLSGLRHRAEDSDRDASGRVHLYLLIGGLGLAILLTIAQVRTSPVLGRAGTQATKSEQNLSSVDTRVLIDSVLYDGYELNDLDEAVALINTSLESVDIGGWVLSDGGKTNAVIPESTWITPGARLWVARDGGAFRRQFGHETDSVAPSWPGYSNSGDEVFLWDDDGRLADTLVYEAGDTRVSGWNGDAVLPYKVGSLFGVEGQILYRRRDEVTGQVTADTDTAADWAQSRQSVSDGRKVSYPGWNLDRFFFTSTVTEPAVLTIAVAPDNAFDTLMGAIKQAKDSIRVTSLTLENPDIALALAEAAQRGIEVIVLLEGAPVGGLSDQQRYTCGIIEQAGGQCWFMINDTAGRIHNRYRYMHAKYMIIDERRAVISSENFSLNSFPADPKADGTWGRRGVILIIDSAAVASQLGQIFADDLDLAHPDVLRWQAAHPQYGLPFPGYVPIRNSGGVTYTVRYPAPVTLIEPFAMELIQSPENSLRDQDGMLGLMGQAGVGDTLLVQQLSERPYWGPSNSDPQTDPNPRLEALIAAARRGATVRLLLDEYFDRASSATSNAATCQYINAIGRKEDLRLKCAQANPTGLGIHNKMILAHINGQGTIHVGSLNGTEQSHKGNREIALQMQSDAAYRYLAELFERDYPHTIYVPVVADSFMGAANHLLISEVYYDPPGPDEYEFIELVNPTAETVKLTGYTLGDAVLPSDFEDVRMFPEETMLLPGETLVVTTAATAFFDAFGFKPDLEIIDSDPTVGNMIDDPGWGDPAAFLQLANDGDEVILRQGLQIVDVVTYGKGGFPGVVACSLLVAPEKTLERIPYWRDSNNCLVDFRAWPFPGPGQLP